MKTHLIAVGTRMPGWVTTGFQEYNKRLPRELQLQLSEISAAKRGKNTDIPRAIAQEGKAIMAAIPANSHVVALSVEGTPWSTEQLKEQIHTWQHLGQSISFLIGGPDGLASECEKRAQQHWSLSPLTLPHPLVRVIVAEQIYRAYSILQQHPYHR